MVGAPRSRPRQLRAALMDLRTEGGRGGPQARGGLDVLLVLGGALRGGAQVARGALNQDGPTTSALARAKALGAASLLAWRQSDYAGE